jgi:thiosulfate/3-mercaptopyruvate sulfurtransferase
LSNHDWLAEHLNDDGIRISRVERGHPPYDTGHIPGAVHIDWRSDLQDPAIRDYISPEKFAELCSRNGITPATTCIFYGDKANWWATYALLGVPVVRPQERAKVLNGGRDKVESGRPAVYARGAEAASSRRLSRARSSGATLRFVPSRRKRWRRAKPANP